ncbi:MAG: TfoX domain-containing protein [Nevskiaceae bacterium]|nr:MAG: TfoX domain-containing protein [Nevskiaceae bacterium]
MATRAAFVDYVAEQLALGTRLTHRKMFGEYALYVDGKVVAFACDNSLFIKPSSAAAQLAPALPQRPPYPEAKNYPVADELLDDPDLLRQLILATAALMPAPKPRKVATPRKRGR